MKNLAQELNISLYFVPAGLTDELQPMDRNVFGSLKSTARCLFGMRANTGEKLTKAHAVADMIEAWKTLPRHVVEEAWDIYVEDCVLQFSD